MKSIAVVPALLALQLVAAAQEATWIETRFHRVHLRNGNFIDGQLVRQTPKLVTLDMRPSGEFSVRRDMIQRVEFVTMRSLKDPTPPPSRPAASELAVNPDAVKLPSGPAGVPTQPKDGPDAVSSFLGPAPARFTAEIKQAVEAALVAFMTAHPDTRRPLAPRLQEIGPEGIAYACWLCMRGRTIVQRSDIIDAIATFDLPEVMPTLLESAASNPDPRAREAAIQGLAKKGTPAAVAGIIKCLADVSGPIWNVAADELIKLAKTGGVNVEAIVAEMNATPYKGAFTQTLGKIGGDVALQALQALLREGTTADKVAALQGLMSFKRPEDGPAALEMLDNEDAQVRRQVCLFLGTVRYGPSVRGLIDTLADEDPGVGDNALWALRKISGQVNDKDPESWKDWWDKVGKVKFPPPGNE
ncbi:MAG TPA: HEAT repeat domain-containing protein [Planctomycetota bacterium]